MEHGVKLMGELAQQGFEVGYVPYALLINGYAKSNYEDKALEVLATMEKAGIHPKKEVLDSLVGVLTKKVELSVFLLIF